MKQAALLLCGLPRAIAGAVCMMYKRSDYFLDPESDVSTLIFKQDLVHI